jgi:hypothetical protein
MERKVISGKSIIVDKRDKTASNVQVLENDSTLASGCRVGFTIDPDGGQMSDPYCIPDGCEGTCELQTEEVTPTRIKYWCDCKVNS